MKAYKSYVNRSGLISTHASILKMLLTTILLTLSLTVGKSLAPPPSSSSSAFVSKGGRWASSRQTPSPIGRRSWSSSDSLLTPAVDGLSMGRRLSLGRVIDKGSLLLMVRGGDAKEDDEDGDTSDDDEYEDTDVQNYEEMSDDDEHVSSDVEIDDDTLTKDEAEEISEEDAVVGQEKFERAQRHSQLSSQSRNFGIATALWGSLFFDIILNKAKRADLFPALIASTASTSTGAPTLLLTTELASGFFLAAGTSFLLWRDLDNRAEMAASDDGKSEKGDWFLSLSSSSATPTSEDGNASTKELFASQTRWGLCVYLALFGSLHLAAHGGRYFSDKAPYLGASAALINVHNTLACVGALAKESMFKEWMTRLVSWPGDFLFKGSEKEEVVKEGSHSNREKSGLTGRVFTAWSAVLWVKTGHILWSVCQSLSLMAAESSTAAVTSMARLLCLSIASLAQHILLAGMAGILSSAFAADFNGTDVTQFRRHPFFAALSGVMSLSCLAPAGATFFESCGATNNLAKKDIRQLSAVIGHGVLMAALGLFAGYNSVRGLTSFFERARQREGEKQLA